MRRYIDIEVLRDDSGTRYYKSVKYPTVKENPSDIIVIAREGDRYDILARKYYNDPSLYWVIIQANRNQPGGSLIPTPGAKIRIPINPTNILTRYYELNRPGTRP